MKIDCTDYSNEKCSFRLFFLWRDISNLSFVTIEHFDVGVLKYLKKMLINNNKKKT